MKYAARKINASDNVAIHDAYIHMRAEYKKWALVRPRKVKVKNEIHQHYPREREVILPDGSRHPLDQNRRNLVIEFHRGFGSGKP